ncbi:MAG: class I SAM-dependent DNA methyltransferase [Salinivenus sp.]
MSVEPYSALAAGYDLVMEHVDYDAWAAYVHTLLQHFVESPKRIVELGGGTGTLAVRLQPMGDYDYLLTDGSSAMVEQARQKVAATPLPIRCEEAEFTTVSRERLGMDAPADAVVLVYDGLNYLLDAEAVATLFCRVHDLLRPGGVAVIDQSTPANSEAHEEHFADEAAVDGFAYVRENTYDPETRRHETTFELLIDGQTVTERHVQRAYTPDEIRALLKESPLDIEAAYEGVSTEPARSGSPRIHWVLRRPSD